MIPTVAQVLSATRGHLGDTAVSGGQIFTDTFLTNQDHWGNAYRALIRWLERNANKRMRATRFYNLPAYTSSVTPAGMAIQNMGRHIEIYEREIATSATGTIAAFNAVGVGTLPSVDVTVTGHGLLTGVEVVAFGFGMTASTVSDDINSSWNVTATDANTIRLNGCAAVNLTSGVGSTGIISTGRLAFGEPMTQRFDLIGEQGSPQSAQLTDWEWEGGAFHFRPASSNRQIKIVFQLSGTPPSSGSIGIDDSLDALALFTAASAASSKGFRQASSSLWIRAIGNSEGDTTRIHGGAFYELAQLGLHAINQTRVVVPRFRPKRNVGPFPWGGIGFR